MYTSRVTTPYRYRARGTFYLIMISAFAVIAITAVLFARGYSIDPKTGIVAKTALFVLGSTPNKAEIRINGVTRKETTNTRIKVPPGSYDISVSKSGTIPYQKTVTVSSGTAILEEDILLFLKEPKVHVLSETSSGAMALSANSRQVFYASSDSAGTSLWQSQLGVGATPQRLTVLPPDFGTMSDISVSSDATRVAVSNGRATLVLSSAGVQVATATLPRAVFSGTRTDTLIGRTGEQWTLVDIPSGKQTALPTTAVAPTGSGDFVYAAVGQTISRVDVRTSAVTTLTAPGTVASLATNAATQTVYVVTTDKQLLQIVSDTLLPIDSRVERFDPSRDDTAVVTADESELRIWRRETGKVTLVTRFSEAPSVFRVHKNGHYVYFEQRDELHAIATDGSNDVALTSLGTRSLLTDSYSQVRLQGARIEHVTLLEP